MTGNMTKLPNPSPPPPPVAFLSGPPARDSCRICRRESAERRKAGAGLVWICGSFEGLHVALLWLLLHVSLLGLPRLR
jgi:hypothetical protein